MAPKLLIDISKIDLDHVVYGPEHIEAYNPHRGAMRLLDAIVYESLDDLNAIAYRDIGHDEFWVEGHIPGRPIFPGVLMIEAAAQFASYFTKRKFPQLGFIGFAGVDGAKFRGQVVPGDRLYILIQCVSMKTRRSVCMAQGILNGNLVFEAKITGMPI
ncbi:MAG: 3-hydroxyacyl-ACP dehydratase FabZ family protein [Planctomycetota bacterium]